MNALFFERVPHRAAQFASAANRGTTNRGAADNSREANGGGQSWSPAVDVIETETEIVLHAELPGMKKEEIEVQLSGETLTLRGERVAAPNREENFHRIERRYGRFGRTFQIETPIDAARAEAGYEGGVLTVRLPKVAPARPRIIEISTK